MTGPGVRSSCVGCGAEEAGAMSTMIAGRETPGTGRWVYQLIANAISAACAAAIAKADAPQRRTPAWSETSWSANAFTALASAVEADQRDLEIAGVAQQVHHLHQVAIADGLVGAQIDALVLFPVRGAVERGGQRVARDDVLAHRDRQIRFHGHEHRLVRARLWLDGARREIDAEIDGCERGGDHEDDQEHQHHVDERRDVDLMRLDKIVAAAARPSADCLTELRAHR